ncbi:MAG TPA: carboxymuconolactone decarboxylase family protein [Alphaproteobacteria bacterium]|nr:carboxymuconolactone decarboxylase family protein [Alphaproteobacteria bacterium]
MPRIPLPTPETLNPDQRRVYDAIASGPRAGVRGPFLALLHQPALADAWQQLGEVLRYRTSFSPRLSELAILVTARHMDCQYEWFAHEQHAKKGGLPAEIIEAVRAGRRPDFSAADDRAVYEYARELNERHAVSPATYQQALDKFGTVGVVELTALVGYYTMVAMTLNAHELPLPAGAAPPLPARRG